jgi:predicted  nucleic acid-binding Zn-ribbon protein
VFIYDNKKLKMPHRCVKCGKIYADASEEILTGCSCGTRFFYYIKQEKLNEIEQGKTNEVQDKLKELDKTDKVQIEKEIRDITGVEEPEIPVILDLESVKVISPGKFEIDIINLFNKKRPLIYKLEEGKYIIDLASTLKANTEEIDSGIKDPDKV